MQQVSTKRVCEHIPRIQEIEQMKKTLNQSLNLLIKINVIFPH